MRTFALISQIVCCCLFCALLLTNAAAAGQQQLATPPPHYQVSSSVSQLTAQQQLTQVTVVDATAASNNPTSRLNHLVALYAHPSSSDTAAAAQPLLTFVNVSSASPAYPSTGQATFPLKLLNVRSPGLVLRLIAVDSHSTPLQPAAVLAESAVITNRVASAPSQVHLALHADGHSLVVQWVSGSSAPQQLQYGVSTWVPAATSSSSRTYTRDVMCGPPASSFGWLAPGFLHLAVIPGSDAADSKQLHYRVGSGAAGWSQLFSLTSPPSSASVTAGRSPFTFLVFNDVGQENEILFNNTCPPYCPAGWQFEPYTANSTKLARHLEAEADASLGLLVGDLSYSDGYLVDWEWFGNQFEQAFSRWPLMVTPGNHERPTFGEADVPGDGPEDGGECGVPYTYRYYTPAWAAAATSAAGSSSTQPFPTQLATDRSYYSFEAGGVHFLMLDSESPTSPDSPQGRFVAADLAQVDRSRTPWLVAALHRMMVGPTTNAFNLLHMQRLQRDLEGVFLQHKVDLVLQGHEHAYARTCPYAKGACVAGGSSTATRTSGVVEVVHDPQAPIYLLAGHAGAGFTHAFPQPLPEHVVFGAQDRNGYLRVTVGSASSLRVVSVSTDDGSIIDGVELVRSQRAAAS